MSAGRLILVTSRFPFGSQEAYLNVELAELARYFTDVVVVPVRPPASPARYSVPANVTVLDWPLINAEILRRAARAAAAAPVRAVRTLGKIVASRDPGRLKNLAVFVKGLALGQWAAENHAGHIHAYWMFDAVHRRNGRSRVKRVAVERDGPSLGYLRTQRL